jgi:spermidine synthase
MLMKKLLLLTSFVTGTALMSLEMVGFRLLAPYFGNSIYVWGNLIGIIMLAISVGYFAGGIIADRHSTTSFLYLIIISSGMYVLLILFFYRPLLESFALLGALYGSIAATLALFAVPMFLLSLVPPYIIKLMSCQEKVGFSVGLVNSISTAGNIFGVYFATFVIIPSLGTRLSLHFIFLTLLMLSVLGLSKINWRFLLLSLLAFLLAFTPAYAVSDDVLVEEESFYNRIVLKNISNELLLVLNSDKYVHSVLSEDYYLTGRYYDYFLLLPLITDTGNMLILGMGAGTSVDQFRFFYPDVKIDAVEIDKNVAEIGKKYFGADHAEIYVEDARPFMMRTKKNYDAIEIDLFQGSPYIPFYVVTAEFFRLIHDSLSDAGVMMMNVYNPKKNPKLQSAIEATILSVFPSLFRIELGVNSVLIATKEYMQLSDLEAKINLSIESAFQKEDLKIISDSAAIKDVSDSTGMILTDDRAPIEGLTRAAINE